MRLKVKGGRLLANDNGVDTLLPCLLTVGSLVAIPSTQHVAVKTTPHNLITLITFIPHHIFAYKLPRSIKKEVGVSNNRIEYI